MPAVSCDLLVIGSGAGGLSAAVAAAFHGLTFGFIAGRQAAGMDAAGIGFA